MSVDELYKRSKEFLDQKEFHKNASPNMQSEEYIKKILSVEQDRLAKFTQVGESNQFFLRHIQAEKELLRWKNMNDEDLQKSLEKSMEVLKNISEKEWTRELLEKKLLEAAGDKRGDLLWPLRAALTGEKKSPSPFECAWVLGQDESLKRLKAAIGQVSHK